MKFTAVTLGLFATQALSAAVAPAIARDTSVERRQISVIEGVLSDVGSEIDGLKTAVDAFTGDSTDVEAAAADLTTALTDGKSTVDASDNLSLADALALQTPVKELTSKADSLKDALIDKRPAIIENSLCQKTRDIADGIATNSNALIDSVIDKVPAAAQDIAEGLAADLRDILAEVKDAFSTANCSA